MVSEIESTATLLGKVKNGDDDARNRLCALYLPMLQRWAHGRLPGYVRDVAETDDMVQSTLIKALHKLDDFQSQHEGAFLAYLRTTLLNQIRMKSGVTADRVSIIQTLKTNNRPIRQCPGASSGR
jgi:DNA-directed RNA polymerase specialized sigma subunit, sigma24 homolog